MLVSLLQINLRQQSSENTNKGAVRTRVPLNNAILATFGTRSAVTMKVYNSYVFLFVSIPHLDKNQILDKIRYKVLFKGNNSNKCLIKGIIISLRK